MTPHIHNIVAAHKNGKAVGITSICSANPFVIRAALEHAQAENRFLCIESTGRQVNPDGGYTGMTPIAFARYVKQLAETIELNPDRIIIGGDHLGPGVWRSENSDTAMKKARKLIRQCIVAGYRKLHLDPSRPCKDDLKNGRPHLSLETIAERTARLCETAETAAADFTGKNRLPVYVVGAEVPTPGGVFDKSTQLPVTSAEDAGATIETMRRAFTGKGLEAAWSRCIAVVVETGAAFGPESTYNYDSSRTRALKSIIEKEKSLVFEAHSTDFQTRQALAAMVRDHFAVLKAGPCLTFAAREALFALSFIEQQWLGNRKAVTLSRLPEVMFKLMHNDRTHWKNHYNGNEAYINYITAFGFSDRIRYYWPLAAAVEAVARLFDNLTRYKIPLPLVSQYLPNQFKAVREGRIQCTPDRLVIHNIMKILDTYTTACEP